MVTATRRLETLISWILMTRQETLIPKKRGPAPTGQGTPIVVRLHRDLLAPLDVWIANHDDPNLSRPEAIRMFLRERLLGTDSANS